MVRVHLAEPNMLVVSKSVKGHDCKSCAEGIGGSIPSPSTKYGAMTELAIVPVLKTVVV